MAAEKNKATVRRYYQEIINGSNTALLDGVADDRYIDHNPFPGQEPGLAGLKQRVAAIRTAFPTLHCTLEDLIAEDDRVAVRWTLRGTHDGAMLGIPPTGKQVAFTGITIMRIVDDMLLEHWDQVDVLGFLQQIGLIPLPGQPPV